MPPRPKKPSVAAVTSNAFADALKFCSLILKDHGTINETHVHIKDNWITAFNGTLAVGHKVNNDLHACPQIKLSIEALSKCGQNIAITQLDNNRLSIKSDKFKAIIPCITTDLLAVAIPDPPVADIDNRLKEAFEICGLLNTSDGQLIYAVSVLMNGQSLIASLSGQMLIEYWHGISLPTGLAIPKAFIQPLNKINKKLTKFGFSQSSITLYFEDDSWIKSQLYAEHWPDIAHVFDCKSNPWPVPVDFWKAVAAVAPFGEGTVTFHDGKLSSHADLNAGAEFDVSGLVGGPVYPARQLAFLQPWATHADFQAQGANGPMLYAIGKNARAVIAGIKQEPKIERKPVAYMPPQRSSMDDNIPF